MYNIHKRKGVCLKHTPCALLLFAGIRTKVQQSTLHAPVEALFTDHIINTGAVHHIHGTARQAAQYDIHAVFVQRTKNIHQRLCRRNINIRHAAHGQQQRITGADTLGQLLDGVDVGEDQRTGDVSDHCVAVTLVQRLVVVLDAGHVARS